MLTIVQEGANPESDRFISLGTSEEADPSLLELLAACDLSNSVESNALLARDRVLQFGAKAVLRWSTFAICSTGVLVEVVAGADVLAGLQAALLQDVRLTLQGVTPRDTLRVTQLSLSSEDLVRTHTAPTAAAARAAPLAAPGLFAHVQKSRLTL